MMELDCIGIYHRWNADGKDLSGLGFDGWDLLRGGGVVS